MKNPLSLIGHDITRLISVENFNYKELIGCCVNYGNFNLIFAVPLPGEQYARRENCKIKIKLWLVIIVWQ